MTSLMKYGVWKQALCSLEKVFDKSSTDVELVYKCSDVDCMVEELRATIQKREDSLVIVHGQRDKAQADLARVKAELEKRKQDAQVLIQKDEQRLKDKLGED